MKVIKIKPTSPGVRHTIKLNKSLLLKKNSFFKNLIQCSHKFVGRSSSTGRITVRHKALGCKKQNRLVQFYNNNTTSVVLAIAYDPNRSSFISLSFNLKTKKFFSSVASDYLFSGFIYSCRSNFIFLKSGYRTSLKTIPAGSIVNNVSLLENSYAKYARSAGTSCQIIQKAKISSKIRLPSGKVINVSLNGFATLGLTSNPQKKLICIGKAGTNRLNGIRPTVRGVAMNPVDHPHGGRTNSGFRKMTPWGILTKGIKTRKSKNIK